MGQVKGHAPHLDTGVQLTCRKHSGSRRCPTPVREPEQQRHITRVLFRRDGGKVSKRNLNKHGGERSTDPPLSAGSKGNCCHMVSIAGLMTDSWTSGECHHRDGSSSSQDEILSDAHAQNVQELEVIDRGPTLSILCV